MNDDRKLRYSHRRPYIEHLIDSHSYECLYMLCSVQYNKHGHSYIMQWIRKYKWRLIQSWKNINKSRLSEKFHRLMIRYDAQFVRFLAKQKKLLSFLTIMSHFSPTHSSAASNVIVPKVLVSMNWNIPHMKGKKKLMMTRIDNFNGNLSRTHQRFIPTYIRKH
jgi:hypothetical protein